MGSVACIAMIEVINDGVYCETFEPLLLHPGRMNDATDSKLCGLPSVETPSHNAIYQ
jgi:hypothetical protein